ncbi:MAG: hypothetical protein AB1505_30715 [Candidatus Latescibacterota bacterium]
MEASTTITIEGTSTSLGEALRTDALGRALAARQVAGLQLDAGALQRPVTAVGQAAQRLRQQGSPVSVTYVKEVRRLTQEADGQIELEGQAGVSAFRVALAAGRTIDRHKVLVAERGGWIAGRLRPLETYGDDAFAPGSERTMASLVQEIHDAMRPALGNAFTAFVNEVRAGMPTVVSMGRSVLKLAADATASAVRQVGARTWGWYGASPSGKPAALPLAYGDEEVQGIDEGALAVYTYDEETGGWLLVGGQVDPAANTVTVSISVLDLYTLAPRIPQGEFRLEPGLGSLPADGASATEVVSDTIS